MDKKSEANIYKRRSLKIASLMTFFVMMAFILLFYTGFYKESLKNAMTIARDELIIGSEKTNSFLSKSTNVLNVTANSLEYMARKGITEEELSDYIKKQTSLVMSNIDVNYTMFYCYYNGKYFGGNNWKPDDDYDATERIWYQTAVAAHGLTVITEPYYDYATEEVLISAVKLLKDHRSVLGLDIRLKDVKGYAASLIKNPSDKAYIIDAGGNIISATDKSIIGKNYIKDEGLADIKGLLEKAMTSSSEFQYEIEGSNYTVMSNKTQGNWRVVIAMNTDNITKSTNRIMMIAIVLMVVLTLILIFYINRSFENEKQRKEKLEAIEKSRTDGLTGLLNKGAIFDIVNDYIKNNGSKNIVFLYMDVDNFKEVNDNFGHSKGDEILRNVADIVSDSFRRSEYVGRLGGDEFCVFIPNIPEEILKTRLNKMVERLCYQVKDENNSVIVSCSIGCIICNNDNENFENISNRADELMYEVKKQGRNGYRIGYIQE